MIIACYRGVSPGYDNTLRGTYQLTSLNKLQTNYHRAREILPWGHNSWWLDNKCQSVRLFIGWRRCVRRLRCERHDAYNLEEFANVYFSVSNPGKHAVQKKVLFQTTQLSRTDLNALRWTVENRSL